MERRHKLNDFGMEVALFCLDFGISKARLCREANIPYNMLMQASVGRRPATEAREKVGGIMQKYRMESRVKA